MIEEQIKRLNEEVRTTIGKSDLGVGIIAIRDIKEGEKCHCQPQDFEKREYFSTPYDDLDKLFPEVRKVILSRWFAVVNGSPFPHPNDVWPIMFMNHSDNPNYDDMTDCALRDIKKGEELTENYRNMPNYEKIHTFLK